MQNICGAGFGGDDMVDQLGDAVAQHRQPRNFVGLDLDITPIDHCPAAVRIGFSVYGPAVALRDVALAEPFAVSHSKIRYRGKASHVAIGLLRQHLPGTARVHGVQTRGGEAPNAIPELTEGRWYVRSDTLGELAEVEPRVRRCFEAGAHATGCELEVHPESAPYSEFHNDADLLSLYRRNASALGRRFEKGSRAARMNRASTDMGNVSRIVPAIHPYIGIDSLPAVNHQKDFAAHGVTATADQALLDGATAMAETAAGMAADPDLMQRLTSRNDAALERE